MGAISHVPIPYDTFGIPGKETPGLAPQYSGLPSDVLRHLGRDRTRFKVDHIEGLFNVQRPRVSLSVNPVPVVEAIRGVAGLLDLG